MLTTGSSLVDAERAFAQAARSRRRAAMLNRLRRRCAACSRLAVYDERTARRAAAAAAMAMAGIREIPLAAITSTLEPSRALQFDQDFRPARPARTRWQRLWIAEHRGAVLPPISVVAVGGEYAVRDGHHRVSVARARGALTIDAVVESA